MSIDIKYLVWDSIPFMLGRGISFSKDGTKSFPSMTSFGPLDSPADIKVETIQELKLLLARESLGFIFTEAPIAEVDYLIFWEKLKKEGHLIVVANDGDAVKKAMIDQIRHWDLVYYQVIPEDGGYYFVFKKLDTGSQGSMRGQHYSYSEKKVPDNQKTCCVIRIGAFGDLLQASSVIAGLKEQGYHITLQCSMPGGQIMTDDPHIDEIVEFPKNLIPNDHIGFYWEYLKTKYDKFVNLSESVEKILLGEPYHTLHRWSPRAREMLVGNKNYIEIQHAIANVRHEPRVKFYPSTKEKEWAREQKKRFGPHTKIILWVLEGSSVHKSYPYVEEVILKILNEYKGIAIFLCSGPQSKYKLAPNPDKRIINTIGKWSIRHTLAFAQISDLVIGPETGVLNGVSCEDNAKIVFLSHSTHENFSRDWKNTKSLMGVDTSCYGRGDNEARACHLKHNDWSFCSPIEYKGEKFAKCQIDIPVSDVMRAVHDLLPD